MTRLLLKSIGRSAARVQASLIGRIVRTVLGVDNPLGRGGGVGECAR